MFYAMLTIDAQQSPKLTLPSLADTCSFEHFAGRYRGKFLVSHSDYIESLSIPSRDKDLTLFCDSSDVLPSLVEDMSQLDSSYEGLSWREKLEKVRVTHTSPYCLLLNTCGTHGHLSVLSSQVTVQLLGVHDPQLHTTHLCLTDQPDLDEYIRSKFPLGFYLYRFPAIVNTSVFFQTQSLCSHWWRYAKVGDILFAFNALERKLFRGDR